VHELSLASAIVRTVCAHADDRRVAKVQLKVGPLRQVVPSSLAFAFEVVKKGTPAEHAELVIEEVPARIACRACDEENAVEDFPFACPGCGTLDVDVVAGDELLVDWIELEAEPSMAGR
jgi:hydrogenase nickel incorporation protein HypA/HybF